MKNKPIVFIGAILIVLIVGFFYNKYRVAPPLKFNSLLLTDLNGNRISIDEIKGRNLFINFFATWCGPCLQEIPSLEKLQSILEQDSFQFIFISDETVRQLQIFSEQTGNRLVIFHSERNLKEYKVFTLPTTYVLNSAKEIVFKKVGVADWASEDMIKKLKTISN